MFPRTAIADHPDDPSAPPRAGAGWVRRGLRQGRGAVALALAALSLPAVADNALPEVAHEFEMPAEFAEIEADAYLPVLRLGLIQHHDDLRGPAVHRVVRQKLPHVTHCVDRMVQAGMPLQGTLHLHFVLLSDGTPSDLELSIGRIPLPEVEDCLHPLVARWPLPSDERLGALDVEVDYLVDLPELDLRLILNDED